MRKLLIIFFFSLTLIPSLFAITIYDVCERMDNGSISCIPFKNGCLMIAEKYEWSQDDLWTCESYRDIRDIYSCLIKTAKIKGDDDWKNY